MSYEDLVDPKTLQKLQDYFCRSNYIYLACVGKQSGVITKAYGSKAEREFIHSMVDKDIYMSLMRKLQSSSVESVIEEPMEFDFIKMVGVTTRIEDIGQVSWVAIGVIEDYLPEGFDLPEGILSTTEERFYHAIEFIEVLTNQFIETKLDEQTAKSVVKDIDEIEKAAESKLQRSETMTELVRLLGSEEGFSGIVEHALKLVCDALDITGGSLIRECKTGDNLEMLCEYIRGQEAETTPASAEIDRQEIPFFTGKPYMISYDSIKPDNFRIYFEKNGISAAIYQPIVVNDKNQMYLCFYELGKERIWSVSDITFVNEVKRIVQMILSKRIAKNSLASSYTSLESILENVGCGIFVADPINKRVVYMNKRFQNVFGKTFSEGKLDDIVYADMEIDKSNSFEERYSADQEMWMDIHRTSIDWVDGRRVNLCTIYDITDKKNYQKKIEKTAKNDYLTGLPNRMSFEQDLERFIRMSEHDQTEGAVIYIDLDDFKRVNDGIGHQYGDVLLKAISHSLQRIDGVGNNVYRIGGDEFVVVIRNVNSVDVDKICSEIKAIFTNPWFLRGEDYYCTTSIGIAYYPTDGNSVEAVTRKADMALFASKKNGKNYISYYNNSNSITNKNKTDMDAVMRIAVQEHLDQFKVYYQPIVNNEKANCVCEGAEALVRWDSPELGLLLPEEFIPTAEYLGLLNIIGVHVITHAVKRCKYWNDMGHPEYKININLSNMQLLSNDLVPKIKEALSESRINPKNVRFEITEGLMTTDQERFMSILDEIKALGVELLLDNFGGDFSSVSTINKLPIDGIKFDRTVVDNIDKDEFAKTMVKTVAELVKTIGLKTVAVGIERPGQHEIISENGINYAQGYYFGMPTIDTEFEGKFL